MRRALEPVTLGIWLSVLPMGFGATADSMRPPLPPDVAISTDAGRGRALFVTLRLESGEELPFVVDTGAGCSLIDTSLESKLGNRLGTRTVNHFSSSYKAGVYAAPKLYLGGTPLVTDRRVLAYDFKRQFTSSTGKQTKAVLGMDCLKHYCIQLDFNAGKMRFLDPDNLNAEGLGRAFPITISNPGNRPFIQHLGLAGGIGTNCLIDTGCAYDGRVEKGTIPGEDGAWRDLPECAWEGQTYTNLSLQIGEHANSIGLKFLARHLVTLDFPHRTLYLKQTGIGPLADERRRGRLWLTAELKTAADFLFQLHQQGRLPGDSKDEHGWLEPDPRPPSGFKGMAYPFSWTFHGALDGRTFTNNYTVLRPTTNGAWQIQRAWRTDSTGQLVEEWPVK